ncbi:MAG TPA: MarR family transcriptional regulator [Candidatus Acidoferrum sp.]|nr:MarR family transcriptional regulator [Candidatus Acidoferrum sp.]
MDRNNISNGAQAVSDLRSHIGFWLRFVSNHVSHAFARRLLATGVTVAEWVVLREMFEDSTMSPGVLAERTGLTRGAISKLIDRLFEKKLVIREESAEDRRYQTIGLTSAGRRLVPRLAALADANDAEFFATLSKKDRDALVATLKSLTQANRLTKIPTK